MHLRKLFHIATVYVLFFGEFCKSLRHIANKNLHIYNESVSVASFSMHNKSLTDISHETF